METRTIWRRRPRCGHFVLAKVAALTVLPSEAGVRNPERSGRSMRSNAKAAKATEA